LWSLEASEQRYDYALDNEKVPVEHSDEELARVQATVTETADRILGQDFEPDVSRPTEPLLLFHQKTRSALDEV
jgi:hypothetical protein